MDTSAAQTPSDFYVKTGFPDFNALYLEFNPKVYSFVARRYKLPPSEAEDVTAEAFSRISQHLDRFRPGNLKGWIFTRSKNWLSSAAAAGELLRLSPREKSLKVLSTSME